MKTLYQKLNKLNNAYIARYARKKILLQEILGFIFGVACVAAAIALFVQSKAIVEFIFLLPLGLVLIFYAVSIFIRRGTKINTPLIVLDSKKIYVFNKIEYLETTYDKIKLEVKGKREKAIDPYSYGDVKITIDNKEYEFYDVDTVYILEKAFNKRNKDEIR